MPEPQDDWEDQFQEDFMIHDEEFRTRVEKLINEGCRERASNTPDFILAEYLKDCLVAFDKAVNRRTVWYTPDEVKASDVDLTKDWSKRPKGVLFRKRCRCGGETFWDAEVRDAFCRECGERGHTLRHQCTTSICRSLTGDENDKYCTICRIRMDC